MQHSLVTIQSKLANFSLALLFSGMLLSSVTQASVETNEPLLPATTTQTLEQAVQQKNALSEQRESKALTHAEIIDLATIQSAGIHIITKNKDGSVRIPSPMQDVIATLTPKGASIYSDDEAGENFALLVNGLGRDKGKLTKIKPGKITSDEKIARLFRHNLIEEFSTTSEGIRQDFVIPLPPKGNGKLVLELSIKNATVSLDDKGAKLTLKSGRELAYHNLMVADASGQTLPAHFTLKNDQTLQIIVDDKDATYPIRIDPTITDVDWFSMGVATPSLSGSIWALASDDAGNIYMGGQFYTTANIENGDFLVKWDGSNWSSLGSGVNAKVKALVWDGANLYAGGYFTSAGGINVNHIAKWNGTNWSALGSGMNGGVKALVWDGTNLYAGGDFTSAGGRIASRIAKWDGNNWSALDSGITGSYPYVDALIWDGSNLYVAGKFISAGGLTANHVARWDGSNWYTLSSGVSGPSSAAVYALAWDGSNLYAGGTFTSASGVTANHIAKWDGNVWSALGSGTNNWVSELVWDGSKLYAGGTFTNAGGKIANRIASWDGNAWSALDSGLNKTVEALLWDGNNIYVGGFFSTAGGLSASRIARWNGSDWNALISGMNGTVRALAWDGANLYIGGDFTYTGGIATNHIARWNGNTWSALNSGMNGDVKALVWDGSNLYAGGAFTNARGITASRIPQLDGNAWHALNSGVNHSVNALLWNGTDLYTAGTSFNTGGILSNNMAVWNGDSWNTLGSGMNSSIYALAWDGTNLYAGGHFISANGVAANRIAKWDGSVWSALGTGISGPVFALTWNANTLFAGGSFTTAGDVAANNIAQWDGNNWSSLGLANPNPVVYALTSNGSNLYAGGSFTYANGIANHIAKWDGSNWSNLGSGTNNTIYALNWGGLNLYTGGNFTTAGGKDAGYVAGIRINSVTPKPLTFTDISDAPLNTLVTSEILDITEINIDVDISITGGEYSLNGGDFTSIAGTASNGDALQLRATSSANYNTSTDVVVTVGSISNLWSVTTLTDTTPDAFNFTDQTEVTQSTQITSNTITITGLGASAVISITGGEYSINTRTYSSNNGFINNTDTVTVRTTSASSFNSAVDVVINIGGISDIFSVTTETDTDYDGVADSADAFPSNIAASVDADNDGKPDEWNIGCDAICQRDSGLTLDIIDTGNTDNNNESSGSFNPILLALFSLFVIQLRRRSVT